MTELRVLQEGRARRTAAIARARRARRRRRVGLTLVTIGCGLVALLAFMASRAAGPAYAPAKPAARSSHPTVRPGSGAPAGYGVQLAPPAERVNLQFGQPPRGGVMFDVRTGRVLWEHDPDRVLAIASLTKMMTALLVVEHAKVSDRVLITSAAVHYTGSGVGLLPRGKEVSLLSLLYGLMLPSGNDAAIALAQHVAGNQARFISMMNAKAAAMGLSCTHFTSVSGIVDRGNHSCATDLAILAHAVLEHRLLARIVASRAVALPFPIKGGKLFLYNNNPLLLSHYPGADGVKTGYTQVAGHCLVAADRRGHTWLGVVMLHSVDPPGQTERLLNQGFKKLGR